MYGRGDDGSSGPGRDGDIERRFREISAEIARDGRSFGDKGNEKLDRAGERQARKLLVASNLDPATLRGGSPAAFASLLTTQQRNQFTSDLDKTGLHSGGTQRSTRTWVESFAPGTTDLIGTVDFTTGDGPAGAPEPLLHEWNDGGTAGARCDVNDGFIHPQYPAGPASKVKPSGAPIDPYNQSAPPPAGNICRATTGT